MLGAYGIIVIYSNMKENVSQQESLFVKHPGTQKSTGKVWSILDTLPGNLLSWVLNGALLNVAGIK